MAQSSNLPYSRRSRKPIEPGPVVSMTSWQAKQPWKLRTMLQSYLNKEFRSRANEFVRDPRDHTDVVDAIFVFLMDVGSVQGLTFDLINKDTVDEDSMAHYGWIKRDPLPPDTAQPSNPQANR